MWLYKEKEIHSHEDLPDSCTNIVYVITYESGKYYLGKKQIRAERRLKPTKSQLAQRKNYRRVEMTNLPFVNYCGSSKETLGEIVATKEILYLCSNKRTATYIELALIIDEDALTSDEYLNKNALGKFFDNCLDGLIE